MRHNGLVMRILVGAGVVAVTSQVAVAQSAIFRAADPFTMPGTVGDATGLAVLADVGSPSGGPDGILDLVSTSQAQVLSVLLGKGDGTFVSGGNTNIFTIPTAIAAARIDGDQRVDVVIGDNSNSMIFLHGIADPPFFELAGTPVRAGTIPRGIAIVDVNRDGKQDAVVVDEGSQSGEVRVLSGNGDGTFVEPVDSFKTGIASSGLAVGDFNGDQKVDVAVCNNFSNDVTILRGDGQGGFTTIQTVAVGQGPIAIAASDFNEDGRLDLVVANGSADSVALLQGRADGTFATPAFFVSGTAFSSPMGMAVGDLNADGDLDVVVANFFSFDVGVLLGNGHGSFAAPRLFVADAEPVGVVVGDLDADGAADVVGVARGNQGPTAAVLLSHGDGGLEGVENLITDANPSGLVSGDLDNDGLPDVVVSHSGGSIRVTRATPSGVFATPVILQTGGDAVAVTVGDFNADGRPDIAAVNRKTASRAPDLSIFLAQTRGGYGAVQSVALGSSPTAVGTGDWNRDGRADLVVVEQEDEVGGAGKVQILSANANGSFGAPTSITVDHTPVSAGVGDFNNDGRADLAVTNTGTDNVSILIGNGNGTFKTPTTVAAVGGPKSVAIADFDRDGFQDLAVALGTARSVILLYGSGDGRFVAAGRALNVDGSPSTVAARDVSGDGIPDILIGDEVSNAVKVYVRAAVPGVRNFQGAEPVIVNRRPVSIAAADFDGDGRYDCAAADSSPAPTASVLSAIRGAGYFRGDGNADGRVSAADAVSVMRELIDGVGTAVEDVGVRGAYTPAFGVDANGDGVVSPQDALATAHRVFNRLPVGL